MVTVLIGPPGVGKSSIGRRLAARLGAPFIDIDEQIVARHGSIPEIFLHDGEAEFRRKEAAIVAEVLAAGTEDAVVALGGGAPLTESTQQLLADHFVVLLDVDAEHVGPRIRGGEGRPLLAEGLTSWQRLYDERRDVYAGLADTVVDTSEHSIDEVVAAVTERIPRSLA